jgi:hypothetical protein
MVDLLPSGVRELASASAHRLFDIVIGRKGNADGGVLACQPSLLEAGDETSDGLAFS